MSDKKTKDSSHLDVAPCDIWAKNSISLEEWVKVVGGGVCRASQTLGIHRATLDRYLTGELETPKAILLLLKISQQNANLRIEKAKYERHFKRLKLEVK